MFRTNMLPLQKNEDGFAWEMLFATPCSDNRQICFVQSVKIRPDGSRVIEEQNPCNILVGDLPKIVALLKEWEGTHPGFTDMIRNQERLEITLRNLVSRQTGGAIPPHYRVVEKITGKPSGPRPPDDDTPMISPI